MLLLTRLLHPPMKKMRLASSSAAAAMATKFATFASYSTASSPVEDSMWLMLPSHEAKDPPKLHKWQDSCFYDIRNNSFVTSYLQNQKTETENRGETPKILGSSHGFLALLHPSDCSLSLAKIPPKFESSISRPYQVHDLPGLETLPEFPYKIFRESEYNLKYGKFQVAGFAFKKGSDERLVLSKGVAECFVNKIVMSDPRSGDGPSTVTVVMSLNQCGETRLAFCQGFDAKRWNVLGTRSTLSDVIYSHRDNKLYGIRDWRSGVQIEVWDMKNPAFPMQKILKPRFAGSGQLFQPYLESEVRYYLVESTSWEILLVIRHLAFHVAEDGTHVKCRIDPKCELPYGTFDFVVFRLSPSGEKLSIVKDLGDEALFLGMNHSFAVSAAKFPGIQGNSIYFTDYYADGVMRDYDGSHRNGRSRELRSAGWKNYGYGGHDFGIFSMEDKCVSPCYPTQSKKRMQRPPVWVAPTS